MAVNILHSKINKAAERKIDLEEKVSDKAPAIKSFDEALRHALDMQSVLQNTTVKDELVAWINRVFKTNFYVPNINLSVPSVLPTESVKKVAE